MDVLIILILVAAAFVVAPAFTYITSYMVTMGKMDAIDHKIKKTKHHHNGQEA